jgi:Ca2+-dependent lipid-binding protein
MPYIYTTTKVQGGKNPVWNEQFEIPLYKTFQIGSMEFKLYDRDINKNDFIGHIKLSINDLVNKLERNKNQCLELRLTDGQNQKVTAVI